VAVVTLDIYTFSAQCGLSGDSQAMLQPDAGCHHGHHHPCLSIVMTLTTRPKASHTTPLSGGSRRAARAQRWAATPTTPPWGVTAGVTP
jgi:hypothetical protein